MTTADLTTTEYDSYYTIYTDKLDKNLNLIDGFKIGEKNVLEFFKAIPKSKLNYRYEENKWSIKEILQHLIDTERIFIYRCFRIARRDKTSLTGYDQNIYIEPSNAKNKSIDDLLSEYKIGRQNSISILKSLSKEDLEEIGFSNSNNMSARAAAFTVIGHDIWHMEVIKKRYL